MTTDSTRLPIGTIRVTHSLPSAPVIGNDALLKRYEQVREKSSGLVQKPVITRYRANQVPSFQIEDEALEDGITVKSVTKPQEVQIDQNDPRLARLAKAAEDTKADEDEIHTRRHRRQKVSAKVIEENDNENNNENENARNEALAIEELREAIESTLKADSEDEFENEREERRRRIRERIEAKAKEAKETKETKKSVQTENSIKEQIERKPTLPTSTKSESDEEEEESEEDEDEDEEESEEDLDSVWGSAPKITPIFLSKTERDKIAQEDVVNDENEVIENANAKRKERLLNESRDMFRQELVNQKKAEEHKGNENDAASDEDSEAEDDQLTLDSPEEYHKWELRELSRIKREREEHSEYLKDKTEVERLRAQMLAKLNPQKEKVKVQWKFMQKYYHTGAFFHDGGENDVLGGHYDFNAPTGADSAVHDIAALPSVLQVKAGEFGKRGRTKYTHLVDQDTTVGVDKPLFTRDEVTARDVKIVTDFSRKQAGMRDTHVIKRRKRE